MTAQDHEKWERYYLEAALRDFERKIYEQCDREDAQQELEDKQ